MDTAVYETLVSVADSDGNIRSAAENQLKELAAQAEFPVSLARLAVSQQIAIPQRQLAALTLKSYVTTHWSLKDDEKFVGPEAPPQSKAAVREIIVTGLTDPESKIRVVCAYVVSKIAHDDFPEDWPNLYDVLLEYLKSSNPASVHGALHVLLEMMKQDFCIQQLPQVGPVLLPEMFRILTSDSAYSYGTRGRAVKIFNDCVRMSAALREENPTMADQFIAPIIPQWMEAFIVILNHNVQGDAEKKTEEYGLKMEVVKCIRFISSEFPKYVVSLLPQLFEPVWTNLHGLKEPFVQEYITDSGDIAETYQDSDGNEVGMQNFLYALNDFIGAAAPKKSVRHLFVSPETGAHTSFFEELLYIYIVFMQITQDQMETWSGDANQYVADEEDGTYTFNSRVAAVDVLVNLQDAFPAPFFNALFVAVQRHVAESNEARNAGSGEWWKIQESCLLAIGRLSEDLTDLLEDKAKNVQFDLKSLFDHVVLEDMQASNFPFLQGRAFVFASEFAKVLPTEMSSQYVSVAVQALQAETSGIPVKISALRALHNYCKHLSPEFVTPYQVNIMENTCQLLPSASEESLMLLLDTLTSAIKINHEVTAKYEQILTPAILQIWQKQASDSIITDYILEIFEELSKNNAYYPALCNTALPFLRQVFTTPNTDPLIYASGVDLLTAMVTFGPSPLPNEFTDVMFPALMQLAWNISDNDLLQSAQECLKKYIVKDSEHIVRWRDESGKSGLDYIIHFVAKLLEPQGTDSQGLFVGDLIVTLIQKVGNDISPVLPDLLNAVLGRFLTSDYQPFIQSLVMVFAHLIITQQDTVFQFLCNTQIQNRSGLDILMSTWCENYDSFSGYYSMKVSAIALSKIYQINDPRLQNIAVKGELIVNPRAGIVTRSRSKNNPDQYTVIPLTAKIIKLLVAEASTSTTVEQINENDADSINDEDGDWEDVGEDNFTDFNYLSDLLDNQDDEEDNPDLKNDPIYQTDIKSYLVEFFRTCNSQNVNSFGEVCQNYLNDDEKNLLQHILS